VHLWGAFGYPVRGIAVAGKVLWYRTEAEQGEENRRLAEKMKQERRERFERDKADLDRQYAALPEVFRRRIDRFRENNPDFRWEYEAYELFCCAEAVKIAHTAIREYVTTPGEWIQRFYKMPYEEQVLIAGIEDGHSGNTFGMACALARLFCEHREGVARAHGALAPLVGSKAYGCVPREDEESKP